jgi:hypothetical protein
MEENNIWHSQLVAGTTCEVQLFDLFAASSLRTGFADAERWILRQRAPDMRDKPLTVWEKYNVRIFAYAYAYWDPNRVKIDNLVNQFKYCGITNKLDGSEDHMTKISITGHRVSRNNRKRIFTFSHYAFPCMFVFVSLRVCVFAARYFEPAYSGTSRRP